MILILRLHWDVIEIKLSFGMNMKKVVYLYFKIKLER